jgi:hypothetical protein
MAAMDNTHRFAAEWIRFVTFFHSAERKILVHLHNFTLKKWCIFSAARGKVFGM